MKRTPLNFLNRKRNVDVIKDMETDPLADWKNGFLLTPKRRSLSQNESLTSFNNSTPAPLATLDEDETEIKENQQNSEEIDDEASTSKNIGTPKARYRIRRSLSVPLVNKESRRSTSSDDRDTNVPSSKQTSPFSSTTDNKFTLSRIEHRSHVFERKRIFTKILCHLCSTNIRFGIEAVKCRVCKSICHQHCSRRAPIPCIPWSAPPKALNGRLRLGDYCADNAIPKLPHLIIRCVQYLNDEKHNRGLYTNYNYSEKADLLLQLILHEKDPPELKSYGPQATAHCVIKFLTDIRESLIPESSFKEFCDAVKQSHNLGIEAAIYELPIVHKNTLAYLFIHWKLLYEQNEINGLTLDALSRALIPVIMRGTDSNLDAYLPVFSRLLSLTYFYWESVIEEGVKFFAKTPISRTSSKKMQDDVSRSITVAKLQKGIRR
jgi:hypothetical protein